MILKVKVCGMRERYNIEALSQLSIDYIGLIFYEKSSRYIKAEGVDLEFLKSAFKTKDIIPFPIQKVGVFVDASPEFIMEMVETYHLDYVQLHGQENVFYCKHLNEAGVKLIKAFAVDDSFSFSNLMAYEFYCDYFLFDTKGKLPGGNGVVFNWELLKDYKGSTPFFLSGGLAPGMGDALINFKHDQFYGIDLNSGFENQPGFKNVDLISEFINKIRKALSGPSAAGKSLTHSIIHSLNHSIINP